MSGAFNVFIAFPYFLFGITFFFKNTPLVTKFLPTRQIVIMIRKCERRRLHNSFITGSKTYFIGIPITAKGIGGAFFEEIYFGWFQNGV